MLATMLVLTVPCGLGLVAASRRVPSHAPRLEWLGGLLLAVGFVGLGLLLAQSAG